MKQSTKIKLFALFAAITLGMFGCVFGQDVKARSFRDESKLPYDSKNYYNLALIISSDGVVEKTDSIQIFIRERDSLTAVMFTVCEKTDLYFAYDHFYLVSIARRGYSASQLCVNSGVIRKEYGDYINIDLEKGHSAHSVGIIVWDSRVNAPHYYPEPVAFK